MKLAMSLLGRTLFVVVVIGSTWAGHDFRDKKDEEWDHYEQLDKEGDAELYWRIRDEKITFQLKVKTTPYIGFGLSRDGMLPNSDVVIISEKGKKYELIDHHIDKQGKLIPDKHEDWSLLSVVKDKLNTVVKMSRKLDTCDSDDIPITKDSIRILFSVMNTPPPADLDKMKWESRTVLLIQAPVKKIDMPKDVSTWDVLANNFTIPGNVIDYNMCRILRGPPLKDKHHVIKVSQVYTPGLKRYYVDSVLFRCIPDSEEEVEEAIAYGPAECYSKGLPSLFFKCHTFFTFWPPGDKPILYSKKLGIPLGEEKKEYFMLLIHYTNIKYENDLVDNSGLRFYYTPNLRPIDSGMLLVGSIIQDLVVIPPRQKEFLIAAHSSPKCTTQLLPSTGIKITTVMLHTHALGTKVKLRHFRDNKELPPIAADMQFDTKYQMIRYLPKDVTVLPTDQLTVECTYDSRERKTTTFGGLTLQEEMCWAMIVYYPPVPLDWSLSAASTELTAGLTGMDYGSGKYNVTAQLGQPDANFRNYLSHYDWNKDYMCITENAMRFAAQKAECLSSYGLYLKVPSISYPDPLKKYRPPPDPCKGMKGYVPAMEEGSRCSDY